MTLTPGEMRSNAEKIADANLKKRVLAGIEALREEYGDDFADYITPANLNMRNTMSCMVGQCEAETGRNSYLLSYPQDLALDIEGYYVYTQTQAERAEYRQLNEAWLTVLGEA